MRNVIVNGFDHRFCTTLVAKARAMQATETLYTFKQAAENPEVATLTPLGVAVMNHISNQIRFGIEFSEVSLVNKEEVATVIGAAEEFLAIFTKKEG